MRKWTAALACILFGMIGAYLTNHDLPRKAWAGVTCTLPIVLQNGTTADANQVMQNFNALSACFNNVATVSSVVCGPGLDGGTITATGTCSLSAARRTNPTVTALLSGSGTYNVPTNALWLEVRMVGGGGGGAGSSFATGVYTAQAGTSGNATLFSSATANPGSGAPASYVTVGGAGGTASGCSVAVTGGTGQGGGYPGGAQGGGSYISGGGAGAGGQVTTTPGGDGPVNSGGGGGGGSQNPAGGAGGYCYLVLGNLASSYSYTVGTGGAGGSGNTPANGGAGGSGSIYIVEHYN
jgi:hypothetical protein